MQGSIPQQYEWGEIVAFVPVPMNLFRMNMGLFICMAQLLR